MAKFIQFARDIRLEAVAYVGRKWYQVPDKLAKSYLAEYPGLAMDVQDQEPGEEAPAAIGVLAEAALAEAAPAEAEGAADAVATEEPTLEAFPAEDAGSEAWAPAEG